MIPYLKAQLAGVPTPEERRSVVREYLQMRILQSLQRAGAMIPLAFHGGTALRVLYQLPRYSEDLDFALERQQGHYDFRSYLKAIERDLTAEAYAVEIKFSDQKVVHSAFVRFRSLLHQLDLTPHRDEVLAIKLEIDTNPPAGAGLATTLIRHHVDVHLQHHDQATLLAGKLHAILQRAYIKGRDWYDLYWYLRRPDWPAPNIAMLNQALTQTGWRREAVTETSWRSDVKERLDAFAWQRVVDDVAQFIMDQQSLAGFSKAAIEELL